MEEKDKKEKFQFVKNEFSSKKKMVTIGIISVVVIVAIIMFCTIFALTNINNTKIISGVKINNIDVSNLSQEEANEKIQNLINDKKSEIIKLKKDEFENDLNVEQLEVNYNVEEAVKEAYDVGRKNNIVKNNFEILSCKNNEKNIDIEFQYNEENLENILNEINGTIPGAAKETSYFIEDSNLIITKGTEGNPPERLRKLLQYIDGSRSEEDLEPEETETLEIAQMANQIKKDAEVTVKYMKQWEKLQKVYHDGQRERSIEDIMELLEDYGVIPEELHKKILSEQDPDTLKKWHKLAAKVSSMDEFAAKM